MPSLFRGTFIGHLGSDAQLKTTPGGKELAEFSIAIDDGPKDAKKTTWIRVAWWAPKERPEWWLNAVDALKKSALVTVIADRIDCQAWKDKASGDPKAAIQVTAQTVIGSNREKSAPAPLHTTQRATDFVPPGDPNDVPF